VTNKGAFDTRNARFWGAQTYKEGVVPLVGLFDNLANCSTCGRKITDIKSCLHNVLVNNAPFFGALVDFVGAYVIIF
jgi:hypothetical protein